MKREDILKHLKLSRLKKCRSCEDVQYCMPMQVKACHLSSLTEKIIKMYKAFEKTGSLFGCIPIDSMKVTLSQIIREE